MFLDEITLIGEKKLEKVNECWKKQQGLYSVTTDWCCMGCGADCLHKHYSNDSILIIL